MAYTHERRVAAGRIRGFTTRAYNDPMVYTASARATFRASFAAQADPDGILPIEEREKRANALYRAHMVRLAIRSSQARAQRHEQQLDERDVALAQAIGAEDSVDQAQAGAS
jgi:hypothetical protein